MRLRSLSAVVLAISITTTASAQWLMNDRPAGDLDWAKTKGDFRAALFLSNDLQAFYEDWHRTGDPVQLSVSREAHRGKPIEAVVIFSNCKADADGLCEATIDFRVLRPDGSVYGEFKEAELWLKKPPPVKDGLQIGVRTLGIRIEPTDPDGTYRVEALVRDKVRGAALPLFEIFRVVVEKK
jgi:hypothetical protein